MGPISEHHLWLTLFFAPTVYIFYSFSIPEFSCKFFLYKHYKEKYIRDSICYKCSLQHRNKKYFCQCLTGYFHLSAMKMHILVCTIIPYIICAPSYHISLTLYHVPLVKKFTLKNFANTSCYSSNKFVWPNTGHHKTYNKQTSSDLPVLNKINKYFKESYKRPIAIQIVKYS